MPGDRGYGLSEAGNVVSPHLVFHAVTANLCWCQPSGVSRNGPTLMVVPLRGVTGRSHLNGETALVSGVWWDKLDQLTGVWGMLLPLIDGLGVTGVLKQCCKVAAAAA